MVLQNALCRDIFLYLSQKTLIINTLLVDKYKNLSLQSAFCNTILT